MGSRIRRNDTNMNKKLDYDFDYDGELEIYKSIGRSKKSKKSELDLLTYMDWKEYVEKKYKEKYCSRKRNQQNFSHFLMKKRRDAKNRSKKINNILIPIEIGIISIICNASDYLEGLYELILLAVILFGVLIWIVTDELADCEMKESFITDFLEIINEDKK